VFGVLGPNGAGKTTTVETIAGLRTPDAGTVRVAGLDPVREHAALTELLGIQLQESRLQPKLTVREALALWTAFYDDPWPWPDLAAVTGLTGLEDRRFGTLSGGQQQRLSIALALIGRPRVVVLDELSTGLDPRARREAWRVVRDLRERGVTVLLVTHSMEEAEQLCDRIAIIDAGRVRALGTPAELAATAGAATVTSFVLDAVPELDLEGLPGVSGVRRDGERFIVDGAEGTALAVLARLAERGLTPRGLRVAEGSLDQAYLSLTDTHEIEETV
jgi:ABC-2 type transport system ATP-binding protein